MSGRKVWVLRIPKCGSGTLVARLGLNSHAILSHTENIDDVVLRSGGDPGPIIAAVRDPVARFRSAFDMYVRQGEMAAAGFRSIDQFVEAGPAEWTKGRWGSAFWRQTYWLGSIEKVRRWGVTVLHTPQLDDQLDALQAAGWQVLPDKKANRHAAGSRRSLFTDPTGAVRDWYAEDIILLEALGYV